MDATARLLPAGLRLAKPARATLFVADYQKTSFGVAYREVGLLLHVKLGLTEAVHCPWMLVDDDVALILGREYLGYPKKLGEISLSIEGEQVRASVARKGTRLLEISGSLGGPHPDPPPMIGRPTANVCNLLGLTVPKLIRFNPPEEVHSCRRADVTVDIRGSEADPLHELGFGKVLGARLYRTSFGGGDRLPLQVLPVSFGFLLRNWALRYG